MKLHISSTPASIWLTFSTLLVLLNIEIHGAVTVEECSSIAGLWYNQLGSQMHLVPSPTGELHGEYRTAVEHFHGARGHPHSKIVGAAPYNEPGAVFAFAVMFSQGNSTTAWTAQCVVCDGEEVIVTSWLLREVVHTCVDKWKATRIGQDLFTRTAQDTEVDVNSIPNGINVVQPTTHKVTKRAVHTPSHMLCMLAGVWYNELGSEMILTHHPNDTVTGEYRTAVERRNGAAGRSHSSVYGIGNVYRADGTMALFVVWEGGKSVTGWVGQCHVCGSSQKLEVLETTWLLRSHINSCSANWKSTLHGQNSFTRLEQTSGPRKVLGVHSPGEEGEASPSTCTASMATVSMVLLMSCSLTLSLWRQKL